MLESFRCCAHDGSERPGVPPSLSLSLSLHPSLVCAFALPGLFAHALITFFFIYLLCLVLDVPWSSLIFLSRHHSLLALLFVLAFDGRSKIFRFSSSSFLFICPVGSLKERCLID
ncbi:hypothetical protein F5X96DRAFT_649684, partial [Biscogniauxia mediterranea]